ncbi:APH(3')-I family aminoglycoside O-phosphotransferase [uncultured Sphingomonas sp.]|uniref:APH(3')-I family aminoglycoside O-phosphotransferase n=1 Tax=uncultured Sphingomonas sp. TaxID=158754 RepID=UPI00260E6807|nr:APH(3')-I family aminoglycoside O-phosphotransferase [uncultured Sphingomonas sp.]
MEDGREEACAAPAMQPGLPVDLTGYRWARNVVGESGAAVYRLHGKAGAPDLFLKHGRGVIADDLTDEAVRLRWLAGHMPVPAIVQFVRTADEAWLLMTAISGRTAYQYLEACSGDPFAVVGTLATFLRRLHAIPVPECSFVNDHPRRLLQARQRIDRGLVAEDEFDDEREGWSAEQVWQAMHRLMPFTSDPVVTHGDFSLDNIILKDGQVVGLIDAGRAGIADRYQDLAILWNCLGEFDEELRRHFLSHYGIVDPDEKKLQFHLMLDELF